MKVTDDERLREQTRTAGGNDGEILMWWIRTYDPVSVGETDR